MKKMLLLVIILAIAFGLLFLAADPNKTPTKSPKKKATPRPTVSVNPYTFPLPQMGFEAGESGHGPGHR